MPSYRFMLSRRWALFAVAVVLMAWGAWALGQWQFGRLADRKASNEIIRTNELRAPAPVDTVLSTTRGVGTADEWRLVTAAGTYDATQTVIVRYRSNDRGHSGVDVVVPLVTADGTGLVVDRGFLEGNSGEVKAQDVPAPPSGEVTVTGWVRVDGTGTSTEIDNGSTRAISSQQMGAALGREVYGGFIDVKTETPAPDRTLQRTDLPELDNGPHFFYGLQWWFFGLLAVFGFFYLAYDERRRGPGAPRSVPPAGPAPSKKPKKVRQTNMPAAYQRPRAPRGRNAKTQDASSTESSKNWVR